MEWRPIETAPKNDWEFLVLTEAKTDEPAFIGFWSDQEQSWCAWYQCCHYGPKCEPTGWLPLPKQ